MPALSSFAKKSIKSVLPYKVRHAIRQLVPTPPPEPVLYPFYNLNPDKCDAIDYAVKYCGLRSFADLGGIWAVDGGYAFYALETHRLQNACIVDYTFTPAVAKWGERYPGLRTIRGNFGTESIANQVGNVDAVFMFDVLLHQVNPDWDAVLATYAKRVNCFVILNQQYLARKTFRLLDRGRDEYFKHVPHTDQEVEDYRHAFEKPNAIHPVIGCTYRDNPSIWQWGITDGDLIAKMNTLGFTLQYFKNCGNPWPMKHVENHAFVFQRAVEPKY